MVATLSLVLSLIAAGPSPSQDDCASMLPKELKLLVARQLPGYALPKQSDNLPEDIQHRRKQGGNGCLGVTTGDFDGDHRKDVAFLVTSKTDVWLVVAFNRPGGWQLEKVWQAGNADHRLLVYVDVARPGKYDDIGLSDTLEPGQVTTFTSKSEVVVTGATESTAIAFWKGPKGWMHLWLSD